MIYIKDITKTYTNGSVVTQVLKGISLEIKEGEWVAIMGKSGAGKSTLLYQMSLLDTPTTGVITIDGVDIVHLPDDQRTDFRLRELGYVFQDYALLPELTALENVMIPMLMQNIPTKEAERIAAESLTRIGLGTKTKNRPNQLSGGEQQRVSIARAVAQKPKILFADEPTANLDNASSDAVIDIMKEIHQSGQTIVMVTHEKEYTKYCDRIIYIDDGKVDREEVLQ
ncbi:MAG: ABC transporter ATP-binding protein [Candidatus Pacebacteria bacterium]|nr:ABC transporter ATP-binding protein [Candidatus Paceibacterota bacterium]MCD8527730.1 ABC transporter ATP-binding protein [Candidatus Paceibacterota bacterium]MCD8563480.1 ABC transporter ATP-binding protein [Candidatus Paceibacterota bacterium]